MEGWGEALFQQLFAVQTPASANPEHSPFILYHEAVREGLDQCELAIVSDNPSLVSIPWELIRDPMPGRGFLAPTLAGLYRQRAGQKLEAPPSPSADGPFRVLLVVARPYGAKDVPLGTVARPMLAALRPLRPALELEVLRPPTFDALQRRLNESPGRYHLVHFDGHGAFGLSPERGRALRYGAEAGHLTFEKPDGSPDPVNSRDLGQALAAARVPLFVLNACQSAEEGGPDPFASVAGQLVATGARGVLAMSYSVYADAAAKFMERFYQSLARGASLAQAVAAARRRLFSEPERESVAGSLPLRDWPVPALYQREAGYFPFPEGRLTAESAETAEEDLLACPEGRFGFIGRDHDLLRLERALGSDEAPWALVTGVGGAGKTELAFGFARWYAETGGCPGGVFAASFKEKADFGQVAGSIAGYGTDLSRLPEEEQWRRLVAYLRQNSCLLVWDNLETAAGYPEGSDALATPEERAKLARFLQALRGGRSRVLLTSRKPDEAWLGVAYALVEIGALAQRDAARMARAVLRTAGRTPEEFRDDEAYGRLVGLLAGHPRSLEVVLPLLRTERPAALLEALQHRVDRLNQSLEDASLDEAFERLSERACRHLPLLGLFVSRVDADILGNFVGAGYEQHRVYEGLMGEAPDAAGWEAVLKEAAQAGLLRPLGQRRYELHPTLSPFLRRRLAGIAGEDGFARLDGQLLRFYAGLAATTDAHAERADPGALGFLAFEEGNLLRALRLAEAADDWAQAQAIAQSLGELYGARGRLDEWRALRGRLLGWVGRELLSDAHRDRAGLWMYLLGNEANDALRRGDLAATETAYRGVLGHLEARRDPSLDPQIATSYHQLGIVAQARGQLDQAETWYRKALEIRERLRLERDAASDYHQLGIVAQLRGHLDQAETWYRKALEIYERLGLERDAADDYHQLGNVAQLRGHLDQAETWYRQALETRERLGLERDAAADYHQLGIVAQLRGHLDQADAWYRKALEIKELLGQPPDRVNTLALLGLLSGDRGRPTEAVAWLGRALTIAAEHQMPVAGQVLADLARLLGAMGEEAFAAAWRDAFAGQEPPLDLLRQVQDGEQNPGSPGGEPPTQPSG